MKKKLIRDFKHGEKIKAEMMVTKILSKGDRGIVAYAGDKSGEVKITMEKGEDLNVLDVIEVNAVLNNSLEVTKYKKIEGFKAEDFLPSLDNDVIEKIMRELEDITDNTLFSKESKKLNDYFFKNHTFLEKFKNGIGGIVQHHNYRGGLAEHTLNVTYLSKMLSYRYDCRCKEIAILGAKLHDIGKIKEYHYDKPFSTTLEGAMEGHILLGLKMVEEAFSEDEKIYSDEFKLRIKGCIVQHHGKVEYGSPIAPNMVESHIIHFSDYVDAQMNKIIQVKEGVSENRWTPYDRRLEGKLYI